jgi:SAM-dependent methyltransferase
MQETESSILLEYEYKNMNYNLSREEQETLKNLKDKKKLNRKDKIKYLSIYLRSSENLGLEIGPNIAPLFSKREGFNVEYIETLSTNELKKRCQDADKNPEVVEEIDYVFKRGKNLVDTVNKKDYYDYVVSSHVIEHIPDLIYHFQEVSTILKESGLLALIIPDKKLCFDYLKPRTTLGQVLQAYLEKRTEPPLSSCIDEIRYGTRLKNTGKGAWDIDDSGSLSPKYDDYYNKLEKMLSNTDTVFPKNSSVHTWFFTCDSFLSIFNDLQKLNLIDFDLIDLHPTGHMDFIVILGKKKSNFEKVSYMKSLKILEDRGYFNEQSIDVPNFIRL